jgi:hypothetical protein
MTSDMRRRRNDKFATFLVRRERGKSHNSPPPKATQICTNTSTQSNSPHNLDAGECFSRRICPQSRRSVKTDGITERILIFPRKDPIGQRRESGISFKNDDWTQTVPTYWISAIHLTSYKMDVLKAIMRKGCRPANVSAKGRIGICLKTVLQVERTGSKPRLLRYSDQRTSYLR